MLGFIKLLLKLKLAQEGATLLMMLATLGLTGWFILRFLPREIAGWGW